MYFILDIRCCEKSHSENHLRITCFMEMWCWSQILKISTCRTGINEGSAVHSGLKGGNRERLLWSPARCEYMFTSHMKAFPPRAHLLLDPHALRCAGCRNRSRGPFKNQPRFPDTRLTWSEWSRWFRFSPALRKSFVSASSFSPTPGLTRANLR